MKAYRKMWQVQLRCVCKVCCSNGFKWAYWGTYQSKRAGLQWFQVSILRYISEQTRWLAMVCKSSDMYLNRTALSYLVSVNYTKPAFRPPLASALAALLKIWVVISFLARSHLPAALGKCLVKVTPYCIYHSLCVGIRSWELKVVSIILTHLG
jgi:hypothetical protein